MAPVAKNIQATSTLTSPPQVKEVIGYWGSRIKITEDPEIVTITPPPQSGKGKHATKKDAVPAKGGKNPSPSFKSPSPRPPQGPVTTWDDELLRKLNGKNGNWKKIAWRPGSGRHVDEGPDSYKPFTHVVRTLHLEDALQVVTNNRMEPKNIVTFSSLDSRVLPSTHPCANLRILWFSAIFSDEGEEDPNWYGNVEFAVGCDILLEMFQFCFLAEMLTTPTHTVSRLLLTNNDYSSVLPRYYRERSGGPWQVTAKGHLALINCSRYRFQGSNMFDHVLEFMLEVTPQDEKKILSKCKISFKNHENAKDTTVPHVCNRHQRLNTPCPSPFPPDVTASLFYQRILQNPAIKKKVLAKLTDNAKQYIPK